MFLLSQSAILGMWQVGWASNCCWNTHQGHLTHWISWPRAALTLFVCSLSIKGMRAHTQTHAKKKKKKEHGTHSMHCVTHMETDVHSCTSNQTHTETPKTQHTRAHAHTPCGLQTSLCGTSGDVLLRCSMCLTRDDHVCCQHLVSPNHHLTMAFCLWACCWQAQALMEVLNAKTSQSNKCFGLKP